MRKFKVLRFEGSAQEGLRFEGISANCVVIRRMLGFCTCPKDSQPKRVPVGLGAACISHEKKKGKRKGIQKQAHNTASRAPYTRVLSPARGGQTNTTGVGVELYRVYGYPSRNMVM